MSSCLQAVDIHVHSVPKPLIDRVSQNEFPGVTVLKMEPVPVLEFPGMAPSPPMPPIMLSADRLAEAAAGQHISVQLLGPWTDFFGYTLPEAVAIDWCRAYNAALVDECAASPYQVPMATLPLSYPKAAADELAAARDAGCYGAMIGTDIGELDLGSTELDPVWDAAAELRMPILVHPTGLEVPPELRTCGLKNAVGRAAPTALALTKFVYGGALERYPDLTLIACHGGGGFPGVAPRVIRNHDLGWSESDVADLRASIAQLYFDSVVLDPVLLRYLVGAYGADRVLLGSDLPFPWEPHPVDTVLQADLGKAETAAILGHTARSLYGLPSGVDCEECHDR